MVHKSLICASSPFFKAACSGTWKESEEKVVRLPEQLPDSFEVYLHMLYTQEFDVWGDDKEAFLETCKDRANGNGTNLFDRMLHHFVLGDVLRDVHFCNKVVDGLVEAIERLRFIPAGSTIRKHWDNLPSNCTMRRVLIDCAATTAEYEPMVQLAADYPHGFIIGIALAGIRDRNVAQKDRPFIKRRKCDYHEHISEEDKCA